jgi:hypothetical protein
MSILAGAAFIETLPPDARTQDKRGIAETVQHPARSDRTARFKDCPRHPCS